MPALLKVRGGGIGGRESTGLKPVSNSVSTLERAKHRVLGKISNFAVSSFRQAMQECKLEDKDNSQNFKISMNGLKSLDLGHL